jgi:hypothetical protein
MKQTQNKMKLFLYICLGLIILNACTFEEEIIKQNGYQEKMKLESKKFSELLKLPAFSNAYKRVINKKVALSNDLAARTALEDQYGFTIVENKDVKIITDIVGSIYYSMLIERAIKENLKFENLVIKVVDEEVFAYILKRELYEKVTYVELNNSYNINVKEIKLTELNVDNSTIASKIYSVRTWIAHCTDDGGPQDCHGDPHHDDWTTACGHYEYIVVSTDEGGGVGTPVGTGTSTGDDGFGTSGAGGNNPATNSNNNENPPPSGNNPDEIPLTNNTPPIKNVIIPSDEVVEEIAKDPCDKIKKQFTDMPTLKNDLINLASKTSQGVENGIYKVSNSNSVENAPSGTNGQVEFPYPTGSAKLVMMGHTHNSPANSTYSIFGWNDLANLNQLIKLNKLDSGFVSYLITADGTRYAFTIDNLDTFSAFFAFANDANFNMETALRRADLMDKYYDMDMNGNPEPLITENGTINEEDLKNFLKFLAKANIGVNLFEADATFDTFTKVTLDRENLDRKPCNN